VSEAPINQSVERAVRLLGFFSAEEPELTLPQLTERLGTSRATTHRYAMALRRVGLLRYDTAGGRTAAASHFCAMRRCTRRRSAARPAT
jgi:DNA-binding IclR family transcriptional regulator